MRTISSIFAGWFHARFTGGSKGDDVFRPQLVGPRAKLDRRHRPKRLGLKAAGIENATSFFNAAAKLAGRININRAALDYLYANRSGQEFSRGDWESAVREAYAIHLIMRNSRRTLPWNDLIDSEATHTIFDEIGMSSRGILLLTFHGGFFPAAGDLFVRRCKEGALLGVGQVRGGSRDPTFAALNALRDGAAALMSPDGFQGRQSVTFEVLGLKASGGAGAAFLAHTSRCKTAWYTVVRQGNRFAPILDPGPMVRDQEDLSEFSDRLHRFYEKKIEANFAGDPNNIVLSERWAKRFAAARS